ncbi:MAG TPA: AAA family ATPase [Candidatus Krumholzibacteria bacterium]|nr:AAA family ATPase [Candidatus Krumholzibacteria bacterium]
MSELPESLGRQRERAKLDAAAADALSGGGGLVLLSGEAGMGATHLAQEFLGEGDLVTLIARAQEDHAPSYGIFRTLLEQALSRLQAQEIQQLPGSSFLNLLVPARGPAPAQFESSDLVDAVCELFRCLSRKAPLCVFLDDLHWSDHASIEMLRLLPPRLRGESILFLVTYRNDEVRGEHPLRSLREELLGTDQLHEIVLEPLRPRDAAELVRRTLGVLPSPPLLNLLLQSSHGIPLHLEEIALALHQSGRLREEKGELVLVSEPSSFQMGSLQDAILGKIDRLSSAARELSEAAAIVGQYRELEVVFSVAGSSEGIAELFDAGILLETQPGKVSFRHYLTRQAILSQISWTRAKLLHKRYAEVLQARHAEPEILGVHLLASGQTTEARRRFLGAAQAACDLHAYLDAMIWANQALELWPEEVEEEHRLEVLEQLSHCARESGHFKDAARALREVVNSRRLHRKPARRARALRALAEVQYGQGLYEHALATRRSAAETFLEAKEPKEAVEEYLGIANQLVIGLRHGDAEKACLRAASCAADTDDFELTMRAQILMGQILAMRGRFREGQGQLERALESARTRELPRLVCEASHGLATTMEYASLYPKARVLYQTAQQECERCDMPGSAQLSSGRLSWVLFRLGEWEDAAALARAALRDPHHSERLRGIFEGILGLIAAHRGNIAARAHLKESLRFARRHHAVLVELLDFWGLAVHYEHEGSAPDAAENYRRMLGLWQRCEDRHDLVAGICAAASFFVRQQDLLQLTRCLDTISTMRRAADNAECTAALAYVRAEQTLQNGRGEEACAHFHEAVRGFNELKLPLEQVRSLLGLARSLVRCEREREALSVLERARTISMTLHAHPLREQIEAEIFLREKGKEAEGTAGA